MSHISSSRKKYGSPRIKKRGGDEPASEPETKAGGSTSSAPPKDTKKMFQRLKYQRLSSSPQLVRHHSTPMAPQRTSKSPAPSGRTSPGVLGAATSVRFLGVAIAEGDTSFLMQRSLSRWTSEPCINSWDFNAFQLRHRAKRKKSKKKRKTKRIKSKAQAEEEEAPVLTRTRTSSPILECTDAGADADVDVALPRTMSMLPLPSTAAAPAAAPPKKKGYLASKISAVRRRAGSTSSSKDAPVSPRSPRSPRASPVVMEPVVPTGTYHEEEDDELPPGLGPLSPAMAKRSVDEEEMQVPLDDDEEQEVLSLDAHSDAHSEPRCVSADEMLLEEGVSDDEYPSESDSEDVRPRSRADSSTVKRIGSFHRTLSLRSSNTLLKISRSFDEKRTQAEEGWDMISDGDSLPDSMDKDDWLRRIEDKKLMREEYQTENGDRDGSVKIVAATRASMVNALANEDTQDNKLINQFLSTYRYFMNDQQLLHLLIYRYFFLPPANASEETIEQRNKWSGPVRLRVINVIKKWLESFYCKEQKKNEELLSFLNTIVIPFRYRQWGEMVVDIIKEKEVQRERSQRLRDMHFETPLDVVVASAMLNALRSSDTKIKQLPKSVLPRHVFVHWTQETFNLPEEEDAEYILDLVLENDLASMVSSKRHENMGYKADQLLKLHPNPGAPNTLLEKRHKSSSFLDVMDVPAEEFARQLTLIEQDFLLGIHPCVDMINVSKQKSNPVQKIIDWSNRLSAWVASEIVQTANMKKRVAVLRRFILIAEECFNMKNFSSMTAIALGLGNVNVTRLKKTWKALPKKSAKVHDELQDLTSVISNFTNLRALTAKTSPPMIPYFALYLKDLSLMELGNPSEWPGLGLVNWNKFSMIADVFADIESVQQALYSYKRIYSIYSWLHRVQGLSSEDLEKQSNAIENRYCTLEEGADHVNTFELPL